VTDRSLPELRRNLEAIAEPADAEPMAAYMQDRYSYLGVKTPARRAASKELVRTADGWSLDAVIGFVDECWAQPEREFQYVGCDVVSRQAQRFGPDRLPDLRRWVATKSWWDTVDVLASHGVGTVTRAHAECANEMEMWVLDDDIWIARTAILHQLRWKSDTDEKQLFRFVLVRAHEAEFFLRKAAGWALREYAKVAPGPVRRFVGEHEDDLSSLTRREALKHLV